MKEKQRHTDKPFFLQFLKNINFVAEKIKTESYIIIRIEKYRTSIL